MGSRGSLLESGGFSSPPRWHTVAIIDGVKVLELKNSTSVSLPERSNTPATSYVSYRNNGIFSQLRVFGDNRFPKMDIDYNMVNGKLFLHKHIYTNGVRRKEHIPLTQKEYDKYRNLFTGVKI